MKEILYWQVTNSALHLILIWRKLFSMGFLLCEKCPDLEFFWSRFSGICTEYRDILCKNLCNVPDYDNHKAGFDNYHKMAVCDHVLVAKILAYVTYVRKYQKAYIRYHIFYLVIFLTIFPKLVLMFNLKKSAP